MSYPVYPELTYADRDGDIAGELETASDQLTQLSRWIDEYGPNADRPLEAQLWGRATKAGEEVGEVIGALIAVTGQNPRKGHRGTLEDVEKELLDVAVSALGAIQHLRDVHGHAGPSPMGALFAHLDFLNKRMAASVS